MHSETTQEAQPINCGEISFHIINMNEKEGNGTVLCARREKNRLEPVVIRGTAVIGSGIE